MGKRLLIVTSVVLASFLVNVCKAQTDYLTQRGKFNKDEATSYQPEIFHTTQESIIFFDDFESGSPGWTTHDLTDMDVMWHPDTFNAYSGNSWWCGMPEIGGYYDVWYQMMITPEIDLSSAIPPVTLSFMHLYRTEGDGNAFWDGGNMRVSTDGGNTYEIIYPSVELYSTDCLAAWDLHGPNIQPDDSSQCEPGYSGDSQGWIDAEFDLSDNVGQSIKIAFVFASDDYLSTVNLMGAYDELTGWFIDNITVTDSQGTLLFDDAGDTQPIQMSFWVRPPSGNWWIESTNQSFSSSHSWHCEDYPVINNVLESPWIELPQGTWPYLSFYFFAEFPCTGWSVGWPDWWNVWISTDSIHWDVFRERTNSSSSGWKQSVTDVFGFIGERVKFRWEMFGGGVQCPSHIYIDDVKVYTGSLSLTVENTNNAGTGSLRNAISTANQLQGSNTIIFNIPDTDPNYDSDRGVWTIKPQTPLPTLMDSATTIDGKTQTENQGDRNPDGPEIEIDGSDTDGEGLRIFSAKNVISGLIINRFPGIGILIAYESAFGNHILGNYIGTDQTGEDSLGNSMGVYLQYGTKANIVGDGTLDGRNTISGNKGGSGIIIAGPGTDNNKVIGNYIGVDASGSTSLGNKLRGVIITGGAKGNVIGGTYAGQGNVISGNYRAGVYVADSDSNIVLGNLIGTDAGGTIGLGNGYGSLWSDGDRLYYNGGVVIDNGSGNMIGDSTSEGKNLISGNYYNGIYVTKSGTRGNSIAGNLVGTDITGISDLGNEISGIKIDASGRDNVVGPNNVFSFNGEDGVHIEGASTQGNTVDGNTITDNTRDGIRVDNVNDGSTELTNNTIKRNLVGIHVIDGVGVPTIEGNVIEDNIEAGILIEDGGGTLRKDVVFEEEKIEYNTISSNATGIHVRSFSRSKMSHYQSTLNVFHNNIFSNTDYGLLNEDPTVTIVADDNWWGDESGPYDEQTNPEGQGDAISGNVICGNWLSDILVLSITAVADIGGIAGSNVYVDFQVYNVGSSTHAFGMAVTDSLGWVLTPDELSLTLAMMTDTLVSIMVTIPEEAEVGTENKVVLAGTSTQEPAIFGSGEAFVRVMEGERGDVNLDRSVNILDVMRVVNIILGTGDPPTEYENWASDCNGDGNVNILDVVGIVNVILGISECEP